MTEQGEDGRLPATAESPGPRLPATAESSGPHLPATAESPGRRLTATDWRIGVWRTFLHAHAVVTRELERELSTGVDLPLGWYDVLLQLAEAPERRLRMAELAARVLLSRSGLTRLVDRLQAAGLVERAPFPDDARGTYTVLTAAGLARLRQAAPVHLAGIQRHWLDHFDDAELRQLQALLQRVEAPASAAAEEPGTPRPA